MSQCNYDKKAVTATVKTAANAIAEKHSLPPHFSSKLRDQTMMHRFDPKYVYGDGFIS